MASSKRVLWNKLGRYFSAIVIAAFFLPFFGVSCEGMDVVTVSGADMVGGCKPGGMITEMEKEQGRQRTRHVGDADAPSHDGDASLSVGNVAREPIAIVALVLAIGLFGAAWVRNKKGLTASFGLSVALVGALIALYIKVGGELKDAVDKESLGKGEGMKKDVKVETGGRYGLWLEGIMLASILYITARALRERDDAPTV